MNKRAQARPLPPYDHSTLEKKWQKKWASSKLYETKERIGVKKFYSLIEFPYPSGEGLHVGHIRSNTAMDIVSRKRRCEGYNVLYPIGWDAFGLPTENYAIKTGIAPAIVTKKNTDTFRKQLKDLGFSFDWSREINTTDPKYYKWTQWIFLQFLKKGLAYKKKMLINWCPKDMIGLANEEVINGACERCGTQVEKKEKEQWMLAITKYAERLLQDLDAIDTTNMPHIIDKKWPPRPGKTQVERRTIHALVRDPKTGKFLGLKWKKFPWITFIVGGVEDGEDTVEAARREVCEETGYSDIKFVQYLGGPVKAEYFAAHKDQNRVAITSGILFELVSDSRDDIAKKERDAHESIWMDRKDMNADIMTCAELPVWLERLEKPDNFKNGDVPLLLDWNESIKESQRNWIGKSEGALIKFKLETSNNDKKESKESRTIEVFTTRPDTLYGVTYVVLAPEHVLVSNLLDSISNGDEVKAYIASAKKQTNIERTDATKEKTGLQMKDIFAICPLSGHKVPIWIADYVLADYGTGAVMAVPAHDIRDWAFAKKYGLPIVDVVIPVIGKPHDEEEFRKTISAIVFDKSKGKFLALKWKKHDWISVPIGGIEDNESPEAAAEREVLEETGYKTKAICKLGGPIESHFFADNKNLWRSRYDQPVLLELLDPQAGPVALEERAKHEPVWMSAKELLNSMTHKDNTLGLERHIRGNYAYCESGRMIASGKYDRRISEEIKKEITKSAGGDWVTKYKLRDWVFSRQRYWGEPIPVVHCTNCAKNDPSGLGMIPVPEKDLPVKLPKVLNYQPTQDGQSPLASITKWVNTKCPVCKGPATRETDTMPNWAGSSWYYLRYCDPKNSKRFADPKKLAYWTPVDWYNGGMEHTTLHLLYSRFWHKFLFDLGLVPTTEPYKRRTSHGLILASDGSKMSKSKGNVINPDEMVRTVGADSLRVYEMFMGPFDQPIAWDTNNIAGSRRFIERVWKLREKIGIIESSAIIRDIERIIHKTVKKVSDDIESMRFNTAISCLMITINEMDKFPIVPKSSYEILLQLLAPFAPHVTEELWASFGNKKSIHISEWPKYDSLLANDDEVKIVVQVNGKMRSSFMMSKGTDEETLKSTAQNMPELKKWLENSSIVKVIVVPDRLVNIVLGNAKEQITTQS